MTSLATAAALRDLPPLLRNEPALTVALGTPSARLAITEVARPIGIAALAHLSDRSPLIVACPTGSDAARLHDDLVHFLGRDECLLFPAWETLPFERVSPAVETMGRGMEVLCLDVATAEWSPRHCNGRALQLRLQLRLHQLLWLLELGIYFIFSVYKPILL